jgi:hypothetical protein
MERLTVVNPPSLVDEEEMDEHRKAIQEDD